MLLASDGQSTAMLLNIPQCIVQPYPPPTAKYYPHHISAVLMAQVGTGNQGFGDRGRGVEPNTDFITEPE